MKRALVLSGGGNKGAFEIGAIHHLITEKYYDFDIFAGASVGALNAGFLAQGADWDEQASQAEILRNKWLSIAGSRDIYDFKMVNVFKLLFGGGLYQPAGLNKMINALVDPDSLERGQTLLIPSVALEDGELYVADSRNERDRVDMTQFMLASASMPVYFPPVKIRGKHWVDGGLRDITPLNAVLDELPQEIIVITTYPVTKDLEPIFPKFSRTRNLFAIVHRVIDILTSEIASNDLKAAKKIARMNQGFLRYGVRLTIISPDRSIEDHCLDFAPKLLNRYYEMGFESAQKMRIFG